MPGMHELNICAAGTSLNSRFVPMPPSSLQFSGSHILPNLPDLWCLVPFPISTPLQNRSRQRNLPVTNQRRRLAPNVSKYIALNSIIRLYRKVVITCTVYRAPLENNSSRYSVDEQTPWDRTDTNMTVLDMESLGQLPTNNDFSDCS